MQTTSATWKALWAGGNARLEARAVIGEREYAPMTAPVITRALTQGGLSVGNVVSASCRLSLLTEDAPPRSARVVLRARLTAGEVASEWLDMGTFFISRRARDGVTGLTTLECYDALLKANARWEPAPGSWPRGMGAVVQSLLAPLGVALDARTAIPTGELYVIDEPTSGETIRDILGRVAQACGGNWILTPQNALRLVPVASAEGAEEAGAEALSVGAVLGGIAVGASGTVTGLLNTWKERTDLIGTDAGILLQTALPPMLAAERAEALMGIAYRAFELRGAVYDPAAELGDWVLGGTNGEVASALFSETATLGPAFRGDISAPEPGELSDEYPYLGASDRALSLARAYAREAVEALDGELSQREIFNRLTNDGAAQGMLLYDGELYINASYINTGRLRADYIDLSAYRSGILAPDECVPASLFAGQSLSDGWIVASGNRVTVVRIPDAAEYRGRDIAVSLCSRSTVTGGAWGYDHEDDGILIGEETAWRAPAAGSLDEDGALIGETRDGNYYRYSRVYTVPEDAVSFYVTVTSAGVRGITANALLADNYDLRYASNVALSYKGLQVGRLVVDKDGGLTSGGAATFLGALRVAGSCAMDIPLATGSGGTGAATPAGARSNLGAAHSFIISNAMDTWADVYDALSGVTLYRTANVYISASPASRVTGGKITQYMSGIVTRAGSTTFDFMMMVENDRNYLYSFRLSSLTDSGGTPGAVYRFAGTAI